jgi:sugar phosphate isomerase/epimerase
MLYLKSYWKKELEGEDNMKIGCGSVNFRKLSLKDALERISHAGYEYVEIQATGPFCPHVDVDNDDPEKISKMIKGFGFKAVSALWSAHGAIIPDDLSVEYAIKSINWAKKAEIPIVNIGDGFKPESMDEDTAWKIFEEKLRKILEVAEENKIYLAVEPHGTFSLTPDGLKRIMNISNSEWLGINYDMANIHRATYVETKEGRYNWVVVGDKQDEVETLTRVIDRVIHVHAKDVIGEVGVALGTGEVNVKGCLKVLKESGYDGVINFETEGDAEVEVSQKVIEDSRNYLISNLIKLGNNIK